MLRDEADSVKARLKVGRAADVEAVGDRETRAGDDDSRTQVGEAATKIGSDFGDVAVVANVLRLRTEAGGCQ